MGARCLRSTPGRLQEPERAVPHRSARLGGRCHGGSQVRYRRGDSGDARQARLFGLPGLASQDGLCAGRLEQEGFTQEQIDGLHLPIGVAIEAEDPEEIAISIAAEMIHLRRTKLRPPQALISSPSISCGEIVPRWARRAVGQELFHRNSFWDPFVRGSCGVVQAEDVFLEIRSRCAYSTDCFVGSCCVESKPRNAMSGADAARRHEDNPSWPRPVLKTPRRSEQWQKRSMCRV